MSLSLYIFKYYKSKYKWFNIIHMFYVNKIYIFVSDPFLHFKRKEKIKKI